MVRPPQALQLDVNVWVLVRKLLDGGTDVHAEHEPDRQALLAVLGTAGPRDGRLAVGEQPGAVFGESLSGGRERYLPAAALKQLDAKLLLELADLPGQGGLGDIERGRGPPEVQPFGDRHEVAQLAQVQVHDGSAPPLTCVDADWLPKRTQQALDASEDRVRQRNRSSRQSQTARPDVHPGG